MDELIISSTSNPRVRGWLRLRDRAGRDDAGRTLVDGAREIGRALSAGAVIREAIVGPRATAADAGRETVEALRDTGVPLVLVSQAVADRLAFGDRADGLVAVVDIPVLDLAGISLPADPLVVILEGVEKPGNLGAVLRSVDGAGADALIAADLATDAYNPNAIRASVGTIFSVPVAVAPSAEVIDWARGQGLRLLAAVVDAPTAYTDVDLTGAVGLVLGSEASGLGPAWRTSDVTAVRLPMRGVADSLNVSVTAAVLLFEARRQRDRVGMPSGATD